MATSLTRLPGAHEKSRPQKRCVRRRHLITVEPKSIHAKRSLKTSWSDPVMLAKLANAYVRAGGDDEKAARILGVTVGSARLAKRRHLGAAATDHRQKAS